MHNKRGQQILGMPFSLIFAIILIVVFVVVAFIAIGSFLDIGRTSSVGMFYDEFQKAVDGAWTSQAGEFSFEINLPSEIKEICFANLSTKITNPGNEYEQIKNYEVYEANVFLIPPEKAQGMQWKFIRHLNLATITAEKNPYCVSADGELRLEKDFYDKSVRIE